MNMREELEKNQQDDDGMKQRYLTFLTDDRLFGVPIAEVMQIVEIQDITRMHDQQSYIKGIINLRGQIIPVIDMRLRLNIPEISYNDRTCIVIMCVKDQNFGLIVDGVDEVIRILPEQISAPPESGLMGAESFFTGIARVKKNNAGEEALALLIRASEIL
ncbi:MAG: chemotaxis protein CheW [Lachnospiraceae bacterium]